MDIGHDLRIKYGLSEDPSEDLIEAWAIRVEQLRAEAQDPELAGRQAALETFGELEKVLYFSVADTIEALLARAREK